MLLRASNTETQQCRSELFIAKAKICHRFQQPLYGER